MEETCEPDWLICLAAVVFCHFRDAGGRILVFVVLDNTALHCNILSRMQYEPFMPLLLLPVKRSSHQGGTQSS